ncbi:MAG: hypothetical protein LBD04_07865 [Synergistaceae bacterium]|jgi:hypothetical protein|nr:hypothetical protein [Synergistaceae bacterium]
MRSKRQKERLRLPLILAIAGVLFLSFAGLTASRLEIARLERLLNRLDRSVKLRSDEEQELRTALSRLTSLARVYEYCKDQWGMITARPKTIHVPASARATLPVEPPGWLFVN